MDKVTIEEIGNATLYHGDCREILSAIRPVVGAVVTDPPYGVLEEEWDQMDERGLAQFTMSWLGLVAPLSKTAVIFFGEKTRKVVAPLLHMLYPDVRQMIWNKLGGSIAEDKVFYSFESIYYCHEDVLWEVAEPKSLHVAGLLKKARDAAGMSRGAVDMVIRGKKTGLCFRWEEAACLPTDKQVEALKTIIDLDAEFDAALAEAIEARNATMRAAAAITKENAARNVDVFTYPPPTRKVHPTEKPVALMAQLVDMATTASGDVLDPFMGSGSTGVACANLGRRFIGVEQDRKYFDLACERITAAYSQQRLFA